MIAEKPGKMGEKTINSPTNYHQFVKIIKNRELNQKEKKKTIVVKIESIPFSFPIQKAKKKKKINS